MNVGDYAMVMHTNTEWAGWVGQIAGVEGNAVTLNFTAHFSYGAEHDVPVDFSINELMELRPPKEV